MCGPWRAMFSPTRRGLSRCAAPWPTTCRLPMNRQIDQIADALGMDPLEIRQKNALKLGSRTHVGQVLKESVNIQAELDLLAPHYEKAKARLQERRRAAEGPWRPGLSIACGWRNIGYVNAAVTAGAELLSDGRIEVLAGTVEQGQGPTTQFAQIACDELGLPVESMVVSIGDTGYAPYPVPTFSSIHNRCHRQGGTDRRGKAEAGYSRGGGKSVGSGI